MSQSADSPATTPPEQHGQPKGLTNLWGFEFLSLCGISVLAFSNIAIFYGFYAYLTELGIPPAWRGPLLALEPLTALLVRPFLGRFLSLANGARFMRVGLGVATLSLLCYPFTTTIPALIAVRILHGLGFVTVVAGLTAVLTAVLPREKSAQGFGLFSVTILLPYAIMPPFVEMVLPHLPGHGYAYALAAPLMLPSFLLLRPVERLTRALSKSLPPADLLNPSWGEVLAG
ncbi:MAG: MFS transporter, partial [Humidesulfovibrio sp.]|nr:MFS transporter [Humidesulfovibrio sp.]